MREFLSLEEILKLKAKKELEEKSGLLFKLDPNDFERFLKAQDANEFDLFISDHLSEKTD